MPEFDYRASTAAGKLQRGSLAAASRQAAMRQLRNMGLTPVQVVAATGTAGRRTGAASVAVGETGGGKRGTAAAVKRAQVLSFTAELATLLRAGLPIDRALKVQEEMSSTDAVRDLLGDLIKGVKGGKSFSAALERHPDQFGNFYLSMVRAGEVSGHLAEVLERLAHTLETEAARRSAVVSALIYPAVLCLVAVISVAVMLGFVIPQFETLFNDMGEGLPVMTAAVLALGKFVEDWFLLLALLIGGVVYGLRRWLATAEGMQWRDERLLSLPFFGDVVQKYALAQFSRTLGTLLDNGVKMLSAITIASDTVDNARIREALQVLPGEVKGGRPLSQIMAKDALFTPLVVQMVRVGEESGRLGSMLLELARVYDDEVEAAIKRILSLIEPALILVMGLVISTLVISILMGILRSTTWQSDFFWEEYDVHSKSTGRKRALDAAGFTLIELLVVLAILALLAGLVGPRVLNQLGGAKSKSAALQIRDFESALEMYKLDVGRYPNNEDGLEAVVQQPPQAKGWNGPYLKKNELPLDPWGNAYQYRIPGTAGDFDLLSLGADGAPGGEGEDADVTNY